MPPIHHRNVLVTAACAGISAATMGLFVCILTAITMIDQRDNHRKAPTNAPPAAAVLPTLTPITGTPFFLASPTPFVPTFTPLVLNNPIAAAPPTLIAPTPNFELHPAAGYQIVIAKHKGDSLFILNQTPDQALPLGPLQLGDGNGAISGGEWGLAALDPGACVTAWKDGGDPKSPDLTCAIVGPHLTRDGPDRFWKDGFNVYYNGVLLGDCPGSRCLFVIPG